MIESILHGHLHQASGAETADGLDADARPGPDPAPLFPVDEIDQLLGHGGFGFPFVADVNVFGVFPEDHHVHIFRAFMGLGIPAI